MVVPIVIRRVTSRGTVFSVLGIVKGLVADRICKRVARAWGIAQEKGHLINVIKGMHRIPTVMDLVHGINSHVSEINAKKGEEESREAARRWGLQKEAELNAVFDDSIAAVINRLGVPHQGYRVSGHQPEFHNPNVPWK
ncbi:hypothetical protein OROMI_014712 [Orobanche minor]